MGRVCRRLYRKMWTRSRYVLIAICVTLTIMMVLNGNLLSGLSDIVNSQTLTRDTLIVETNRGGEGVLHRDRDLSQDGVLYRDWIGPVKPEVWINSASGRGQAHLPFPRKDLDKSNYTSDAENVQSPEYQQFIANIAQKSMTSDSKERNVIRRFHPTQDIREKISRLEKIMTSSGVRITQLNHFYSSKQKWPFGGHRGRSLPAYRKYHNVKNLKNWEEFHLGIRQFSMYDPDDGYVGRLVKDVGTQEITEVEMKEGGTQLKLVLTFKDRGQALFKPMRYDRSYETPPNHFYFSDFERHNAEIAAYHLDRVLGFYRSPPVVGRLVNITRDLRRLAHKSFAKTFFISPADNVCFTGKCSYYCDTGHAFCGTPDVIEGSLAVFLPSLKLARRATFVNPWKRSYSKRRKADWELHDDYCDSVKNVSLYNGTKRMLDMLDTTVFDFITGNMDRHHYEVFTDFGNDTFIIHLDHGRAFGKVRHDELSILTPIRQCCLIRHTTFLKLLSFHHGPTHLSDAMRMSLSRDKLSPILADGHFEAMDRRVATVLVTIETCVRNAHSHRHVILDDGF